MHSLYSKNAFKSMRITRKTLLDSLCKHWQFMHTLAILRVTNVFRLKLKHETESAFISKLFQIAKQQFLNIFVNSS